MKAYTDIEQSKKLAEILPIESADMYYHNRVNILDNFPLPIEWKHGLPLLSQEIPCWSLAALINAMPEIQGDKAIIYLSDNYVSYTHLGINAQASNLIDACYEMILILHE